MKKVLIVDDDELTIRLLTSRLQDSGHKIVTACTGQGALEQMLAEHPDVVIMDIMLPDMQGTDVVRLFQDNPDIADIRVIFLSGIISPGDDADQRIHVGGRYYPAIAKPVDFTRILTALSGGQP